MRLDKYLVLKGFFTTRHKAKEAIKMGHVILNNRIVRKPSTEVRDYDVVKVMHEEKPAGYWKLKKIDEEWGLIKEGDVVLDIGSSSGGFLLYASEKASKVYGIEFSREFESVLRKIELENENVKIFIEDAFTFDISKLEPVDLILNDLTLDANSSLKALNHFLPLLKKDGKILFVLKTGIDDIEPEFGKSLKLLDKASSEKKKERYYLLSKL